MALKFLNSGYFAGLVGIGTVTNSDEDTNNGVPRLQVTTATAVLGEFPLAARFTTASDAGNNSGVSVLINSGNDRGLMISAGRQTGNVSKVTLNVVKNDGVEIDTITLLQNGESGANANVGIGTTSPNAKLHAVGTASSTKAVIEAQSTYASNSFFNAFRAKPANGDNSAGSGLWLGAINQTSSRISTGASYATGGQYYTQASYSIMETTNGDFKIFTGFGLTAGLNTPTERMRISSAGNVGIGTTGPVAKLHVIGTGVSATDKPTMQSQSVLTVKPIVASSGNLNFATINGGAGIGLQYTNYSGTANWDIALQPFGGNVGINVTDPDAQLEIVNSLGGSTRLGYSGGSDSYFDSENFYVRSGNGNTNKFIINSSGNVGIGTTSPAAMLDVSGDAIVRGATLSGNTFSDPDLLLSVLDTDTTDSLRQKMSVNGTLYSAITKVSDSTAPAPGAFQVSGSAYPQGFGPSYKIEEGDTFTFELWIKWHSGTATNNNLLYAGSNFYDASGTYLGNAYRYWGESGFNVNSNTGSDWYHISGTLGPSRANSTHRIPTAAVSMKLTFLFNYSGQTASTAVTRYCGLKVYKSGKTVTQLYRKTLGSSANAFPTRSRNLVVDSNGDIYGTTGDFTSGIARESGGSTTAGVKFWSGDKAQYDALGAGRDQNTVYYVTNE